MIASLVQRLEDLFFRRRALALGALLAFTLLMAAFAVQLKMDAGFDKQLPQGHEFIQTFNQYRDEVFGANRIGMERRGFAKAPAPLPPSATTTAAAADPRSRETSAVA